MSGEEIESAEGEEFRVRMQAEIAWSDSAFRAALEASLTIGDLCRQWDGCKLTALNMEGLLDDLEEHQRSAAPVGLYVMGFSAQVHWLVNHCEPPYTPDEIEDYLIDCLMP
jgi:hypothetical protein